MCDCFSGCVRLDGAWIHVKENSHSLAIEKGKWTENDAMADMRGARFIEAEWGGIGKYPGAGKICRGTLNEKQVKTIDRYYQALAELLADPAEHAERMCFDTGIFAGEEYADVRWKVIIHPSCPKRIATKLAAMPLFSDGSPIKSLHPGIKILGGNLVIAEGVEITAPALTEVTGYVAVSGTFTAPALTEVTGSVDVMQGGTFTAPALTEVTGYVAVSGTFTAPALTEVTGSVDVMQGGIFTVPKLQAAKGAK